MDVHAVDFRHATAGDWASIWLVFHAVVAAGDTYAYPPDITESNARNSWMHDGTDRRFTYVAGRDGSILGTAYLEPNQTGLGDHVANAGWMIDPAASGQGIGRRFASHVIEEAKSLGFSAMQLNAVASTNLRAVALWESMGFEMVGTVPDAFRHSTEGPTAIHIMYRSL